MRERAQADRKRGRAAKEVGAGPSPTAQKPRQIGVTVPPEQTTDLVTIALIVRPHGIKGEVAAELKTDFPDRFDQLDEVYVRTARDCRRLQLSGFRFHQNRLLLKFAGIDNRDDAELLRDASVQIEQKDLVELPEGSYYQFDLIGCAVHSDSGEALGAVKDLLETGAAPLLVVTGARGELLIPFVEEICRVEMEKKLITVTPPEGLLDL